MELLDCDIGFLREWLTHQFADGMSWENYGPVWELDHVQPCCSFDFSDAAQQRICFRWSNLRPMLVSSNRAKNGRPLSQREIDTHANLATDWEESHPKPHNN